MPAGFTITVAVILGALVGSFLNVLILRIPKGRRVVGVKNRSRCPRCRHVLHVLDLIPVFSYLALRGRCRYCHKSISAQYLAVELLTAAIFGLTAWQFGVSVLALLGILGGAWFVVLGVIDGKFGIVPDRVSVSGMVVLGIVQILRVTHFGSEAVASGMLRELGTIVLAAAAGAGWFAAQWAVSKGRWVGSGDIRLGALMGIFLGLPYTLAALFVAYVVGSVWAVVLLLRGRVTFKTAIPFGSFLAFASVLTFLFGPSVVSWYQRALGW